MAKGVQKHKKDMKKSIYHHGLIKMIVTYELQNQNLSWQQQFLIDNEFETMKEEHEEEEFIPVDDEEDVEVHIIMNHEATTSK